MTQLDPRPNSPRSLELKNSYTIIEGAFDAASSFLVLFDESIRNSNTRDALGDWFGGLIF